MESLSSFDKKRSYLVFNAGDVKWICNKCDQEIGNKDELVFDGYGRAYHSRCWCVQVSKKVKP